MKNTAKNMTDNQLDDLFRIAHMHEEAAPVFDPSFFDEIIPVLPNKKDRKPILWWSVAGSVFLFFGLGSVAFIVHESMQTTSSKNRSKVKEQINVTQDIKNSQQEIRSKYDSFITNKKSTLNDRKVSIHPRIKSICGVSKTQIDRHFSGKENPNNLTDQLKSQIANNTVALRDLNSMFSKETNDVSSNNITIQFDTIQSLQFIEPKNPFYQIPLFKSNLKQVSTLFVKMGFLVAQSPRKALANKSNIGMGVYLGAGIEKQLANTRLSFGGTFRVESFDNVVWKDEISQVVGNQTQKSIRTTNVQEVFSIDMPLKIEQVWLRNSLGLQLTPGFQLATSGSRVINNTVTGETRNESVFETPKYSQGLTMEFAISHGFNLNEHLEWSTQFGIDILRPFQQSNYQGEGKRAPLSIQTGLVFHF